MEVTGLDERWGGWGVPGGVWVGEEISGGHCCTCYKAEGGFEEFLKRFAWAFPPRFWAGPEMTLQGKSTELGHLCTRFQNVNFAR